eukprot:15334995-Ditylum_brightwellii.AAC.1
MVEKHCYHLFNNPIGIQAHSCSAISDEPYATQDQGVRASNINETSPVTIFDTSNDEDTQLCRDVSICGLWQHQMDTIFDVRAINSDMKSYKNQTVGDHLEAQEKEKKE